MKNAMNNDSQVIVSKKRTFTLVGLFQNHKDVLSRIRAC